MEQLKNIFMTAILEINIVVHFGNVCYLLISEAKIQFIVVLFANSDFYYLSTRYLAYCVEKPRVCKPE